MDKKENRFYKATLPIQEKIWVMARIYLWGVGQEDLLVNRFQLTVNLYEDSIIGMGASDEKLLFALGLKRQRLSNL